MGSQKVRGDVPPLSHLNDRTVIVFDVRHDLLMNVLKTSLVIRRFPDRASRVLVGPATDLEGDLVPKSRVLPAKTLSLFIIETENP